MKIFVICDGRKIEIDFLKEISTKNIARVCDEKWKIKDCLRTGQLKGWMENAPDFDVVYLDVTMTDAISIAEKIRKENKNTIFLLIADTSISPVTYLKPSIQAASLLLRPFQNDQVETAVADTWNLYMEQNLSDEETIQAMNDEEKIRIPYPKISYFESCNKRVCLTVENQTYSFSDTLGNIEKRLPDYFVRCHRSFIVNRRKIKEIYLSQGEIILEDDTSVPISRSYKPVIKELRKCLK